MNNSPFLFDKALGNKCARLDIALDLFDSLLMELGHGSFGGYSEDWGSVFELKAEESRARGIAEPDEEYDIEVTVQGNADVFAGVLAEIINIVALTNALKSEVDEAARTKISALLNRHRVEGDRFKI